jgi:hypothetical protein
LKEALNSVKKRGPQRDIECLTDILLVLFRQSKQDLTIYDLLPRLSSKYPGLKKDTLEDNIVDCLSKIPDNRPFVEISHEVTGKLKKPKNIYKLSSIYINEFYTMPHVVSFTTSADIVER